MIKDTSYVERAIGESDYRLQLRSFCGLLNLHTQKHGSDFITSTTDVGGKNVQQLLMLASYIASTLKLKY